MATSRFDDINLLREAIAQRAVDVAVALLGEPNRRLCSKRELRFGNKGSIAVAITGSKAGHWYDHENGEGGDLFWLIQRVHRCSFGEVISYAKQFLEGAPPAARHCTRATVKSISPDRETTAAYSLKLFSEAIPIVGTPAAEYLDWRGILEPATEAGDGVLRFHPSAPFGNGSRRPCMLALLRDIITDVPRAIQRTALNCELMRTISQMSFARFTEAGGKIARMSLGLKTGTAIKLCSHEAVSEGLAAGEGLETVLASMRLGLRPAWALGDAANVRTLPVLSGIECLTILVDNDESGTGQRAALECSRRWTDAGREVFRLIPNQGGEDFNDIVRRGRRELR